MIFDLDGVIVDSEIWWDDVRKAFAVEHGRTWDTGDRASVMGANSAAWARTMRERLSLDVAPEVIERAIVGGVVERFASEGASTISGAVAAVRRIAADRPVAIASSAHRAVIDAALRTTGLDDVFRVVVSSDEVEHGKPAPDVYLLAAERLGADPVTCLVVEDSLNGVKAAKAAGMTVVLVPNASVPSRRHGRARGRRARPSRGPRRLGRSSRTRLSRSREAMADRATKARPRPARPASPSTRPPDDPLLGVADLRLRPDPRHLPDPVRGRGAPPPGPAIYCFNHLSWVDPFVLMAILPFRPRLFFFGGGHGRRRPEPGHEVDRDGDRLQARQERSPRGDPARVRGDRVRRRRRDRRGGPDRRHRIEPPPFDEGGVPSRCGRTSRSSRSPSTARPGCGSAGASASASGSRSPPRVGRTGPGSRR